MEPLVVGLYDTIGRYLPGQVLGELAGETGGHNAHIATGAAVALSFAYWWASSLVGAGLTVRRDVT